MGKIFNLDSPVMTFLTKVADLIILNFVALICCIPIITIGASMTGLHYVALKIVRNEECYIIKSFFKSFKQNFKQATVIWLILLVVYGIFAADVYLFVFSGSEFPTWMLILFAAVAGLTTLGTAHAFPILARFDNTVRNTLKNSFLLGILIFPKTILEVLCWAIPWAILYFLPQITPIAFCFLLSGPALLGALLYNRRFKMLEPEAEDITSDEEWTVPVEGEEE